VQGCESKKILLIPYAGTLLTVDKYNLGVLRPRTQEGICILPELKTNDVFIPELYMQKYYK